VERSEYECQNEEPGYEVDLKTASGSSLPFRLRKNGARLARKGSIITVTKVPINCAILNFNFLIIIVSEKLARIFNFPPALSVQKVLIKKIILLDYKYGLRILNRVTGEVGAAIFEALVVA
jgi:hypothetical protein